MAPGGRRSDKRRFVEAVLWVVRAGSPWRDLPSCFGKRNTSFLLRHRPAARRHRQARLLRAPRRRRLAAEAGWRTAHSMFAPPRVAKYILGRSFAWSPFDSYPSPIALAKPQNTAKR